MGPRDSPLGSHLGYDAFATSGEPYDGLTHVIEIEEPVGSPHSEAEEGINGDTHSSTDTLPYLTDSSDEHAPPVWTYQQRMERTKEVCSATSPDQSGEHLPTAVCTPITSSQAPASSITREF